MMRMRLMAGLVLVGVFFVLPQVSLEDVPPPAYVGSRPVKAQGPQGAAWLSEPFAATATIVGLSWEAGRAPERAWVRTSTDGVQWGPWLEVESGPEHGPDPGSGESARTRVASEPVYVGEADFLQFRILGSASGLRAEYVETAGRQLGVLDRVGRFFSRIRFGRGEQLTAQPDRPDILPRSAWGGDACLAPDTPEPHYSSRVQVLFWHHTSGTNSYTAEQVPEIIYAICSYHVNVRGWDDIGYNFLIDRFGTIYEGRRGGIYRAVIGAQTGGFNSYSTGVAILGNFRNVPPSQAAQDALVRLAAWKLDLDNVDPLSTVTLESLGSSLFPEGTIVELPAVAAHRDASLTDDPGDAGYAIMDTLRQRIAALGLPKIYGGWPDADPVPGLQSTGYDPATFAFRMTEPMSWTLTLRDASETVLAQYQGSGTEGSVTWDGTLNGVPLPAANYTVEVTATPLSGAAPPTPATFEFQLGSYLGMFGDDEGSIHEADIDAIAEAGITQGCGPTVFCPTETVARWQMALFLTRLWEATGVALPDGADQGFTDLGDLPMEVQMAVNQLRQLGVTAGVTPESFDPYGEVARWQMALFLIRFVEAAGYPLPVPVDQGFTDISDLPIVYQEAINRLGQLEITSGTSPTTYDPALMVTRAQMASFLYRTMTLLEIPSSP